MKIIIIIITLFFTIALALDDICDPALLKAKLYNDD